MKPKYEDYPLVELQKKLAPLVKEGATFHLKFTCIYCGSRQTCAEENVLFETGRCEECGSVTNIGKTGGNYLLIIKKEKVT